MSSRSSKLSPYETAWFFSLSASTWSLTHYFWWHTTQCKSNTTPFTHTYTHRALTITQCKSNTTHTHITVRAHREQAHRQGTLHTITTTYNNHHSVQVAEHAHLYVCIYQWGQLKMSTSTSCRWSIPSWALVGAGCRVAKLSDRLELVRLLSQHVHLTTAVFLVLTSTINTIAAIVNLQIMFAIRRIVAGEMIFTLSVPSAIYFRSPCDVTTNCRKSSFDDVTNYKMIDFGN